MQTAFHILAVATLLCSATAALTNNTREYYLRTALKPGQTGKERFDNLYPNSYHTGAGLGDAVLYNKSAVHPGRGYTVPTNLTLSNGKASLEQRFDLGNEFPWGLSEYLSHVLDLASY